MRATDHAINLVRRSTCPVCAAQGGLVYPELQDRLFHAPGTWSLRKCDNAQCGALWLDPHPCAEDLHKLYDGYYTHAAVAATKKRSVVRGVLKRLRTVIYDAYYKVKFGYGPGNPSLFQHLVYQASRLNPHWQAHLDFGVFYLAAQDRGDLLEIGCGGGTMLQAMQSKGWKVTGLDFDMSAVSNARSKGLQVLHGDLLEVDLAANSFDAIVMSHVIEHLPDPKAILARCLELLKPGGKLVMITPNAAGRLHKTYGKDWRGLEPPRHLTIYTPGALEILARSAGFGEVGVETTIRDAGYLRLASESLKRRSNYDMGQKFSLADRISGEGFGLLLSYRHSFQPGLGDELVAICRKH